MNSNEPSEDEVDKLMEQVGIGDAVDSSTDGKKEEEDIRYVAEAVHSKVLEMHNSRGGQELCCPLTSVGELGKTYFEVSLGTIFPQVKVSTSIKNGIIDKTL